MKKLHVAVSGSHLPPSTFYLMPNTSPEAVLKSLKLEFPPDCYALAPSSDPARDLFDCEDLYSAVEDGQRLIIMTLSESAALSPQAAGNYATTFLP
jgi:hypothetical protein